MQPSCLILERLSATEILCPVVLKETANLLRSFRGRFRCRQPLLHLRAQVSERFDGIRLQSGITEKTQMFAQRQHVNMRRIAKFLPAVLILRPLPMFTCKNVFHQHSSSDLANT